MNFINFNCCKYNYFSLLIFAFLLSLSVTGQTTFSPVVEISLSSSEQNTLSDISVSITQEADESDISSCIIVSDGGSFVFSSLSIGDAVGGGSGFVAGGSVSGDFTLYVSELSSSQATLQVVDNSNNDVIGSVIIENISQGVSILTNSPSDGNSITAGNTQDITLSNIFTTPQSSSLTVSTTLIPELDFPTDVQTFNFVLNASPTFSPVVEISLSSSEQNTLSDISIKIIQEADESDISSCIIVSDGGSFVFSSLSVGDVVGGGSGFVAGGSVSGDFTLYVSELSSSQATLQVVDNSNNDVIGSVIIENISQGVSILTNSPSDGNSITAGNTQDITLSNIFTTPQSSSLTVSTTLIPELDFPTDIQTFNFDLSFVEDCLQPGDANCDNIVNLADLSLVINNWLTETLVGQNGDVIGSEDGFVNLSDLSLIINNWLQSIE